MAFLLCFTENILVHYCISVYHGRFSFFFCGILRVGYIFPVYIIKINLAFEGFVYYLPEICEIGIIINVQKVTKLLFVSWEERLNWKSGEAGKMVYWLHPLPEPWAAKAL